MSDDNKKLDKDFEMSEGSESSEDNKRIEKAIKRDGGGKVGGFGDNVPFTKKVDNFGDKRKTFGDLKVEDPLTHKSIAKKGGESGKGKPKMHYTKCIDCEARFSCIRAFEEYKLAHRDGKDFEEEKARCVYELEGRKSKRLKNLATYKAFVSGDPRDLLLQIEILFNKLSGIVDDDPSYTKVINMIYLLNNIYKLKFGEKHFVQTKDMSTNNPTVDIKAIMREIRTKTIGIDGSVEEKEVREVEVPTMKITKEHSEGYGDDDDDDEVSESKGKKQKEEEEILNN